MGADVWLKLETLQPTGSFKVRGALVAVEAALARDAGVRIVTASAGNHGLGVAFAAAHLGADATIVVPVNASEVKLAALAHFPATVVRHGDSYDEAERHALELAARGFVYVSPYNDPDVISGQASIALELHEQLPDLASIVAPIGGGGLASGLALAASTMDGVSVRAVEAERSPAWQAALAAGEPVTVTVGPTLADGLAGNLEPGTVTFPLVQRLVAAVGAVSEAQIEDAIRFLVEHHGIVAEGSAAVAVAGVRTGRVVTGGVTAVVVTGRNLARSKLAAILAA